MSQNTAFTSTVTTTRPADTTAYTAGDVVGGSTSSGGGILTFSNIGPNLPNGVTTNIFINQTSFLYQVASVISGMTNWRLHLYNSSPVSALADNAAWTLSSGDFASYLGYLDLGAPATLGSGLYSQVTGSALAKQQFQLTSRNLYGYLVTNGGYTPNSADVFRITLASLEL